MDRTEREEARLRLWQFARDRNLTPRDLKNGRTVMIAWQFAREVVETTTRRRASEILAEVVKERVRRRAHT